MPSISQRMAQSEGRPIATRRPAAVAAPGRPPRSRQPFVPTTQGDWGAVLGRAGAQARRDGPGDRSALHQPPPPPPPPPPSKKWRRYVDAASGEPCWHDAHSGATTWDEPATQPPPPPPRKSAGSSCMMTRASARITTTRPPVAFDGTSPDDRRARPALFAVSGKAVPPPPSEEEEAAPPARTLRRPSNPWQKKPAAPVVDSSERIL